MNYMLSGCAHDPNQLYLCGLELGSSYHSAVCFEGKGTHIAVQFGLGLQKAARGAMYKVLPQYS